MIDMMRYKRSTIQEKHQNGYKALTHKSIYFWFYYFSRKSDLRLLRSFLTSYKPKRQLAFELTSFKRNQQHALGVQVEHVPHVERPMRCCEGRVDFDSGYEQMWHAAIVLILR